MSKSIIALADGNNAVRNIIKSTLSGDESIEVVEFTAGNELLEKMPELKPRLVLVDVNLPVIDGYDVCKAINDNPVLSDTQILLLKGSFVPLDEGRIKALSYNEIVSKPFNSAHLANSIGKLLKTPQPKRPPQLNSDIPTSLPEDFIEADGDSPGDPDISFADVKEAVAQEARESFPVIPLADPINPEKPQVNEEIGERLDQGISFADIKDEIEKEATQTREPAEPTPAPATESKNLDEGESLLEDVIQDKFQTDEQNVVEDSSSQTGPFKDDTVPGDVEQPIFDQEPLKQTGDKIEDEFKIPLEESPPEPETPAPVPPAPEIPAPVPPAPAPPAPVQVESTEPDPGLDLEKELSHLSTQDEAEIRKMFEKDIDVTQSFEPEDPVLSDPVQTVPPEPAPSEKSPPVTARDTFEVRQFEDSTENETVVQNEIPTPPRPEIKKDELLNNLEDKAINAIKDMLWEILPPLAEKIIKEEIDKIKGDLTKKQT